jgi:glutathione S-transferase
MSLELYHHGTSVCAARVRLAIAEKGVHVDRYHYVDILKGEQFADAYLRINPNAVVPALVHDGRSIVETTLISEYLDEVFDGPPLQAEDPYERYRMRHWLKAVDELLHPACAEVTYVACHRHIINRLPAAEREAYFASTPERSVKGAWRQRKRELVELGFAAPGVDSYFRLYASHLDRMEAALTGHDWLAGERLTLADLALAPYLNRLDMLAMAGLWSDGRRPAVAAWFERMRARPSFGPGLVDFCPPELAADMRHYGAESWPEVEVILAT